MIPEWATDIVLYYGLALAIGILLFFRRGPRFGMQLRLRGGPSAGPREKLSGPRVPNAYSHIQPEGERPLNVVFNYNGHSWDAYEVLGLPAGSSVENVERAYQESLRAVDGKSHAFLHAAHAAILAQWRSYRATGN